MKFWGVDNTIPLVRREELIQKGYLRRFLKPGSQAVVLQTCDRYEVYYGHGPVKIQYARRLFEITAGLRSPLLGENSIQGQVKKAYQQAACRTALNPHLHRLFQAALRTGKRVRKETKISQGALSHTGILLKVMAEKGLYFRNQRIIILGVNKLTRSLLKSLSRGYFKTVLLGNRSHPQAKLMADRYGAEAFGLEELPRLISNCDVVVSATSAPHLILRSEDVPFCGPNLFFDLAVPRDLDPQLGNRPGTELWDVSRLEQEGQKSHQERRSSILAAQSIVEEELERYEKWQLRYKRNKGGVQTQSIS